MSFDKEFGQPRTIGVAGVTKRGVAHRCYGTRCQDAHMIRRVKQVAIWKDGGKRDRLLPGKEYVVAAVADGLGSEAHSDIGAHAAVNTAVSTMCELIGTWCATGDSALAISMPRFLEQAMIKANNAVVKKAASMELPANEFDATLAIAVYDGDQLFFASAGDSGVIAKTDAGFELVTHPSREGEASTYPLYCKDRWEIGVLDIMCKDSFSLPMVSWSFWCPSLTTRSSKRRACISLWVPGTSLWAHRILMPHWKSASRTFSIASKETATRTMTRPLLLRSIGTTWSPLLF